MRMQRYIRDHQGCVGGDCNSCSLWRKCVQEYLDHLTDLMRKKRFDK